MKYVYKSLQGIIEKLQEFGLVHGDFRSCNILAKRSSNNPKILEDFKLLDFELSGKVNTTYPNMAFRNESISWPEDYFSYNPRKFEHDLFMLEKIKKYELYLK